MVFPAVQDWMANHETILWWLGSLSLFMFVATLIAVPIIVARLPTDYFARPDHHRQKSLSRFPLLHAILMALKNLVGVVLVLAGIAMLVLPGQGLLTIAIGIMLMNFPGKYRLEQWLVGKRPVYSAINWLRRRAHQPPMLICPAEIKNGSPLGAADQKRKNR